MNKQRTQLKRSKKKAESISPKTLREPKIQLYEFATKNDDESYFQAQGRYTPEEFKNEITEQNPITVRESYLSDVRHIYLRWGTIPDNGSFRKCWVSCNESSKDSKIHTVCLMRSSNRF